MNTNHSLPGHIPPRPDSVGRSPQHQNPQGNPQANPRSYAPQRRSSSFVAAAEALTKTYGEGDTAVHALRAVNLGVSAGEFVSIMGPSGSGKSTLLHLLAGLDVATSGSVRIEGVDLAGLSDKELTKIRRDRIGYVFQSFNLVPTLDARANILLPDRLAGRKTDAAWFDSVVKALGIEGRLGHLPSELSGGQQQRVAVARALVTRPAIIVADEPTGNLDSTASEEVLGLLRQAVAQLGQTVIMVTHDRHCALQTDRVVALRDGLIVADLSHPTADEIAKVA